VLVIAGIFKCDKCTRWHAKPASAFVLTSGGAIVTNYHVLQKENNETFLAMTHDGKVYPVKEVLAADKADDLAIVQLELPEGVKLAPLPLAPDAPVGSPVTLISHPDRRFYSLTTGIISRYHTVQKNNQSVPMVSITADYARGSSGAPVLSDRGAVVGIVASTHSVYYTNENGKQENLQMVFKQCIPAASLMKLIEASN
jgi:S1-C subfamily serine protease